MGEAQLSTSAGKLLPPNSWTSLVFLRVYLFRQWLRLCLQPLQRAMQRDYAVPTYVSRSSHTHSDLACGLSSVSLCPHTYGKEADRQEGHSFAPFRHFSTLLLMVGLAYILQLLVVANTTEMPMWKLGAEIAACQIRLLSSFFKGSFQSSSLKKTSL